MDVNQIFVAYNGVDIAREDIISVLKQYCNNDYIINDVSFDFVTLAKIVKKGSHLGGPVDPRVIDSMCTSYVAGYNCDELLSACQSILTQSETALLTRNERILRMRYETAIIEIIRYASSRCNDELSLTALSIIIEQMYKEYECDMFKILSKYMHFCAVIFDDSSYSFIAGVTTPNNSHTNLYYGFTSSNHELIFSNCIDVLEQFCGKVYKMKDNTYMLRGKTHKFASLATIDKKELEEKEQDVKGAYEQLKLLL